MQSVNAASAHRCHDYLTSMETAPQPDCELMGADFCRSTAWPLPRAVQPLGRGGGPDFKDLPACWVKDALPFDSGKMQRRLSKHWVRSSFAETKVLANRSAKFGSKQNAKTHFRS